MSERLIPGAYFEDLGEWRPKVGPFGLEGGQSRDWSEELAHNSGWYNDKGQRIGKGSLSAADFARIRDEVLPHERFIVLSEDDAFWNIVEPKITHDIPVVRRSLISPGKDYVDQHALYIVETGVVYRVFHSGKPEDRDTRGLPVRGISPAQALALLASPPKAK